jgi:arylsulfatase A-like enzyme
MMSGMDDAIGRVMAKFREIGQDESTVYFFIGDNGGPTQSTTSQNGGLRGFKMTTFEGGPRVPFLAQWKGKLPAGKVYDFPVMNLDVLPTLVTAAGGQVEPAWKLDGVDLLPYVMGANKARPHETMYWRYGPQWGIRHGDMKLVVSKGGSGQPELYDLANDRNETKDLASAQPEKARQLQVLYNAWSAEQAEPSAPDAPAGGKKAKKAGKSRNKAATN